MLELRIKPVWVFDGLPPDLKRKELVRRKKLKREAKEKLAEAKEVGDTITMLKQAQRTVKMTSSVKRDAMKMLELMGMPVVEAAAEAEAQCVQFLKEGRIDAVASEDMDCLTLGCTMLLRGVKKRKLKIQEIDLKKALEELELTMDEFIDFCILCGSDYTDSIKNLGPVRALSFIKEHKNIENVLEFLKKENLNEKRKMKYIIPSKGNFLFEEAREMFKNPEVHLNVPKVSLVYMGLSRYGRRGRVRACCCLLDIESCRIEIIVFCILLY